MSVKLKDFEKLKEKYEKLVADHEVLKFRMKYYKGMYLRHASGVICRPYIVGIIG